MPVKTGNINSKSERERERIPLWTSRVYLKNQDKGGTILHTKPYTMGCSKTRKK
jgi:hypothetical protein